jgi:hypothetical protein
MISPLLDDERGTGIDSRQREQLLTKYDAAIEVGSRFQEPE